MGAARPRTPPASRPRAREELGRYWNRLPDFLAELRADAGASSSAPPTQQIPTLRRLRARGARAGPLPARRRAVRARVARLDRAPWARPPTPATSASDRVARRRSPSCAGWPSSRRAWASRCASSSRRSTTASARSRTTPRPRTGRRPRPTRPPTRTGQGFTGMEALWNYVYFQTLGINGFDEIGPPAADRAVQPGALLALRGEADRGRDQGVLLVARPEPAGRDHRPSPSPRSAARGQATQRKPREREPVAKRPDGASDRPPAAPKTGSATASPRSSCPPQVKELLDRLRQAAADGTPPLPLDGAASSAGPQLADRTAPRLPARAMSRRRRHPALVASPVLVGAVTVLVALIVGLPRLQRQQRACRSCPPTT